MERAVSAALEVDELDSFRVSVPSGNTGTQLVVNVCSSLAD